MLLAVLHSIQQLQLFRVPYYCLTPGCKALSLCFPDPLWTLQQLHGQRNVVSSHSHADPQLGRAVHL